MSGPDEDLEKTVGRKAERRDRARREGRHTVWFGFGMFGLVGWAVAVPTCPQLYWWQRQPWFWPVLVSVGRSRGYIAWLVTE